VIPLNKNSFDTRRDTFAAVIAAWPNLPAAIRAAILAMVRAIADRPA